MEYCIKNENLQIVVSTKGAELQSIKNGAGVEFLWQGDDSTWKDRAINLFPYIARLTEGKYTYKNKTYEMPIHGFASTSEFELIEHQQNRLVFMIKSDSETKKMYPFEFLFFIEYELVENKLNITYRVENKDNKQMYFGVGGHPGFAIPRTKEIEFEDYFLEFETIADTYQVGMSEDCFVTGKDKQYPLKNGKYLELSHSLFDQDAIILKNMSSSVILNSDKDPYKVRVCYPDMKYLGLWHWPRTEVNYICIEPWTSLPSRKSIVEDIEQQENLISLDAGKIYKNTWSIEILKR